MRSAGLLLFLSLIGIILVVSAARFTSGSPAPGQLAAPAIPQKAPREDSPGEKTEAGGTVKTRLLLWKFGESSGPASPSQVSPGSIRTEQKKLPSKEVFGEIKRLEIPSIKLTANVIYLPFEDYTWDVSTLGQDIARLGSMETDRNNNLVLAGHVTLRDGSNGPFRYLAQLKPGEPILVHTEDKSYMFTVRERLIIYPEEVNVTTDTELPQLTLITCTSWDKESLTYLRRQVIVADLEKVDFINAVDEID